MKRYFLLFLLIPILSGCGTLIPKRVEIGQDKVVAFPRASKAEEEIKRQAVARITEEGRRAKSGEVVILGEALGRNIGPPLVPFKDVTEKLVVALDQQTAKYDMRVRNFVRDNDANQGKKIEGTGWLSVPYFVWVGGFLVLTVISYAALKLTLGIAGAMNPGVSLGLNAAGVSSRMLSKAFAQVVKGGQLFKKSLDDEIQDPGIRQKVREIFVREQSRAQDEVVRDLIKKLKE